jgi:hypothetical protein
VVTGSHPAVSTSAARRVVWTVALLVAGFNIVDGFFSLQLAESAPQQAAGAAMSMLYIVGAYVIARGIDAIAGWS